MTALLVAAAASFVFLRDPFQVFRRSAGVPDFYGVPEYQIPGIARHYPYDSVVTGSSTSNNFRPRYFAEALGWHTVNFSIAGSTIPEQRAILDLAIAAGKARHVVWGIDPFAFRRGDRGFPYYLYRDPGWRTVKYLLNLGAVWHGLATMGRRPDERTSLAQWMDRVAWDGSFTFGREAVATAWEHRRSLSANDLPRPPVETERAARDFLTTLAEAHPDVDFRIVLLPYAAPYFEFLKEDRPAEFEAGCALDLAAARQLAPLPNARVYDFRTAREITANLDEFKDLLHFSAAVSRRIVGDVAADRHRLTAAEAIERRCPVQ